MYQCTTLGSYKKIGIKFIVLEVVGMPILDSLKIPLKLLESHIIQFISSREHYDKEAYTVLSLEILHEPYLMLMNVTHCKCISGTFLCIEADRNALYNSDIVYRTFLVKICQRDVPVLLVDFDRRNRGRDLLDQCQIAFLIFFNTGGFDQPHE